MPTKPNLLNANLPLNRSIEIFVDGYPLPLVTSHVADVVSDQPSFDVFGLQQQLYYRVIDGQTVRLEGVDDETMATLYALSSGQKPNAVGPFTYSPRTDIRCHLLRAQPNAGRTGYDMVEFYANWNGVAHTPAGGPRDRGNIVVDGRSKKGVQILAPRNSNGYYPFMERISNLGGALVANFATVGQPCDLSAKTGRADGALWLEAQCCQTTDAGAVPNRVVAIRKLDGPWASPDADAGIGNMVEADFTKAGLTANITSLATEAARPGGNQVIVTHLFAIYMCQDVSPSGQYILGETLSNTGRYE